MARRTADHLRSNSSVAYRNPQGTSMYADSSAVAPRTYQSEIA